MRSKILTFGVLGGLIVGLLMFINMTAMGGHEQIGATGLVLGYLTMLIALSMVFIGIKRYRDHDRGGVIRFWPAFAVGLGISFIASVFYTLSWEAVVAYTDMDFANDYAAAIVRQQQAAGVTGAALAKVVAEMEAFKVQYANPLYRLPMVFAEMFPVGVLVSLISAALLRKSSFMPAQR